MDIRSGLSCRGQFWCIDSFPIYLSHVSWFWAGVISFLHCGRWQFVFVRRAIYVHDNMCSTFLRGKVATVWLSLSFMILALCCALVKHELQQWMVITGSHVLSSECIP